MTLRGAVTVLGLLALAAAAVCAASGRAVAALWLAVNGLVLTLGVAWERWRYKSTLPHRPPGNSRPTGERFIDPETGRLTEVYYDPVTGERSYVQGSPPPR